MYGTKGFVTNNGLVFPSAPLGPLPTSDSLKVPKIKRIMITYGRQNSIRSTSIMLAINPYKKKPPCDC